MKLDGAGDGPPNRDESNNYSRQMAELVRREKQAKKRQVRIYIQNVFENCNFYNLIFFCFRTLLGKDWKTWKMPGKLRVIKKKKMMPKNVDFR